MKWTNIHTELPPENNSALFFSRIAGMIVGYYKVSEHGTGIFCDEDNYAILSITHWMPLPEPPYES